MNFQHEAAVFLGCGEGGPLKGSSEPRGPDEVSPPAARFLDGLAAAKERFRQISQVPVSDDPEDVDYRDLLLEYKEIQKQLDNIKKEEEKAVKIWEGISSGEDASAHALRDVTMAGVSCVSESRTVRHTLIATRQRSKLKLKRAASCSYEQTVRL